MVNSTKYLASTRNIREMLDFYPRTVRLDATWRCNLNCRHCQTSMFRGVGHPDDLTTNELFDLFEQLASMGTENIAFLGGEPLLRDDLLTLLKRLRHLGITSDVTTNGLLIDSPTADILVNETCLTISVSLDGSSPETHDRIRGNGSFKKAFHGLQMLLNARGDSSAQVGISAVLNACNIDSALSFLDIAMELNCDYLILAQVHPVGSAIGNWQDLALRLDQIVECGINIGKRIAEGTAPDAMRIGFYTPAFVHYLNSEYGYGLPIPHFMDQTALYECYIECDGRVFPSQKSSEMVPRVLDGLNKKGISFTHNSVRDLPFKEIWNSSDFRAYRDVVIQQKHIASYTPCARCKFSRSYCMPPAAFYFADETEPQPICSYSHVHAPSSSLELLPA